MWHEIFSYFGKHDSVVGALLVFLAAIISSRMAFLKIMDDQAARRQARIDAEDQRKRDEQKEKEAEHEKEIVKAVSEISLKSAINTDLFNRAIMDALTAAVVVAGADNKIILWNDAACALFGWTEHEAVGRSITLIIPDDMRGAHLSGMERYKRTGDSHIIGQTINMRGQHKNGRQIAVTLSLSEGEDEDKNKFFVGLMFPTPAPMID